MDRIHILGGPGSGKSYLARRLAALLKAPVCHLDSLFWDERAEFYGTRAPTEQCDQRLREFLEQPRWIVEGVYHQWVQESFLKADAIIVLKPSVLLRDWRILRRFIRRRLGLEEPKRERVRDFLDLVRWNHGYNSDNLRRATEDIAAYAGRTHACRNADEACRLVADTMPRLKED